ncbi:MAG: hypothetical protein ACPG6O_05735, partial [Alloalcanivorax venustensis]
MRTLSRGALAVVLSITGLAAPMAASAALSRAQLEDLEHHLWQVRTDYHMYAVMDGNDTYRVALNEAAQQAAEAQPSQQRHQIGHQPMVDEVARVRPETFHV